MKSPALPCLAVALALASAAASQERALVLRGATVIDGTERPPMGNTTVVIERGWITAIGGADLRYPKGARVVDLSGRFLLPGFIEMHGHLAIAAWQVDTGGGQVRIRFPYDEAATRELTRSQLAFGITTVRNPAGPTNEAVSIRDRVRRGELPGPRIITAGAPLDRPSANEAMDAVTTEEEIRAAVRRQTAVGVDFIKLYHTLDSAQVRVAVDEAHRLGLTAVGHLWFTSWTDAALEGIDGITHIIVNNAKLLPESKRAEYQQSFRGAQFMFDWFKHADFDGPEIQGMIKTLVDRRVTIDPTLVAFEWTAWANDSTFYSAESARFVPPSLAASTKANAALIPRWSTEDYQSAQAQLPRMFDLTRRLHRAGVLLTVGTDAANPWMFHRELELLVKAGIPPAEVLRMATRNGAIALKRSSEFGTVAVGRVADLVVLDGDPLADITNTRRIAWVIHEGRLTRPTDHLPERLRP